MKFSTAVATTALSVSVASAISNEQVQEINAIVSDINAHQAQYINLELDPPAGFTMPAELLQLYQHILTYTDDSYTTLFSTLDFSAIANTITYFSWYSERLLPVLESIEKEYSSGTISNSSTSTASSKVSSVASSSSAASFSFSSNSTISSKDSSSAVESSSSSSSKASSSSSSFSSSAASSSKDSSSSTTTSSKDSSSSTAISSKASSSSSKASSSKSGSANGAERAFVGMGAGVVAIAALLL